jgi:nicotinamidase-related amidase
MPHWQASDRIWCRAGTPGALPPETLAAHDGEPVFAKQFYSPFENPALAKTLARKAVKRLVVAGLYTHACVRSGVVDGYAAGLEVFLPTDAVASSEPDHAAMTIAWLEGRAARCLPTDRLLALLDGDRS